MALTADEIEKIVSKLLTFKKTHSTEEINEMSEFEIFRLNHNLFYNMIVTDSDFDMKIFKEMMKMKRRLESGEDQYSVDVKFGQFMADKYLKPIVEKLDK
jgi:hypothetical protein